MIRTGNIQIINEYKSNKSNYKINIKFRQAYC